ncbi:MAG: hypothetical protein DMF86_12685 [Acidobacteria bacterium]|nr:MAG: hypothetical protein DMF86_12685 [Acidobacteriota bacterium]
MTTAFVRRVGAAGVAALVLALLVLAAAPLAADAGVLTACVNPGNGNLRLVGASDPCHANESRVQWNIAGPAGPTGPTGPQGPAGSAAAGPPYIWVCTPVTFQNAGSNAKAEIHIFNGAASTANVAVNILDRDGVNLAGVTVPGSSPPETYPGDTGTATVAVPAAHTRVFTWTTPQTYPDGVTNVSAAIRITSDQPIGVGAIVGWSGFIPLPCSFVHP